MLIGFNEIFGDDLRDPEFAAAYLAMCLEEDGMETFLVALKNVIKTNGGMTDVAKAAGLGRESMYKALSAEGNPEFKTVCSILNALGMHLTVVKNESPAAENANIEMASAEPPLLIAA